MINIICIILTFESHPIVRSRLLITSWPKVFTSCYCNVGDHGATREPWSTLYHTNMCHHNDQIDGDAVIQCVEDSHTYFVVMLPRRIWLIIKLKVVSEFTGQPVTTEYNSLFPSPSWFHRLKKEGVWLLPPSLFPPLHVAKWSPSGVVSLQPFLRNSP
jgi:hypothetical protein